MVSVLTKRSLQKSHSAFNLPQTLSLASQGKSICMVGKTSKKFSHMRATLARSTSKCFAIVPFAPVEPVWAQQVRETVTQFEAKNSQAAGAV